MRLGNPALRAIATGVFGFRSSTPDLYRNMPGSQSQSQISDLESQIADRVSLDALRRA